MTLVVGLTGGIASGKSTVSKMLVNYGFPIIDADVVSREVVEVGEPAYEKIVETFGKEILSENLKINRPKLGAIIFNDEQKRMQLNHIVHPAVRQKMNELKMNYINNGEKVVILDIPLLFESKLTHLVEKTLLIYVDDTIQLQRLMARNNLTEQEALARIRSQMPLEDKIRLADEVINNNGTIEETAKQLELILKNWEVI
ncbi:dephospho-CoA kinase [Bacillus sp. Marseille-P3661]|uniref:dephospho-CoA kinase n=1 Tax=Bacillus sp. Marseille-P3661 TaxID=1936234 RepID=UPI000C82FE10|nr:dephospho-CoA kinase [Bacillus sp. Marseille-P3661]